MNTEITRLPDVPPTWMVFRRPIRCIDGALRRWERMAPSDSYSLEQSYLQDSKSDVDLQFGRYIGNAHGRWMLAYYWRENKWPLVRGTWFWKDPSDGNVCPFGEADATTMEEAFRDISSGVEEGPIDVELVDTDIVAGVVQFVREVARIQTASPSDSTLSPLPAETQAKTTITYTLYRSVPGSSRPIQVEVFRGYPVEWVPTSEEKLEPSVSHLVLLLHGIGEQIYNRGNDILMGSLRFRGNCDVFRENLNNCLFESGDKSIIKGRIEVLPLEWSECVHNNTLDRRLESVTIPNLTSVRDFANLALSDVFLYTQPEIKDRLAKFMGIRIKNIVKKFVSKHRTENPIVTFVGHSLGSVILYDLFNGRERRLSERKLSSGNFNSDSTDNQRPESPILFDDEEMVRPAAMFFLGSPMAMFQTIRDPSVSESPRHFMDLPCRLFNVFHPYDAIAYRIEPLVDSRMKDLEPIVIPHRGGHRVHVALRKSVLEIKNAIAMFGEWMNSAPGVPSGKSGSGGASTPNVPQTPADKEEVRFVKMVNYNERIDYMLQESAAESVSEWVSAVGSHFTYWRHEDVHTFIVNKLIFITKNRANLNFF
jgi:hypothetical protein